LNSIRLPIRQIDLASRLGKTQAFVSQFINGQVGCSLETAEKLSELFGQSPIWWMKSSAEDRRRALCNGNHDEYKKTA